MSILIFRDECRMNFMGEQFEQKSASVYMYLFLDIWIHFDIYQENTGVIAIEVSKRTVNIFIKFNLDTNS